MIIEFEVVILTAGHFYSVVYHFTGNRYIPRVKLALVANDKELANSKDTKEIIIAPDFGKNEKEDCEKC